jgi:hypothetical protein
VVEIVVHLDDHQCNVVCLIGAGAEAVQIRVNGIDDGGGIPGGMPVGRSSELSRKRG